VYSSQRPVYSMHTVSVGDSWSSGDRADAEILTDTTDFQPMLSCWIFPV